MSRVLQVVLSLNAGGTERLVLGLAERLHAEIPMAICCLDEPGVWAEEAEQRGIHVSALRRRPGFHPLLSRGVARAAQLHQATVIHAHHYSPVVYAGLARAFRPSTRVVFTEHGRLSDAGPSTKRRMANRGLAGLFDSVFAVSEDIRRHLIGEGFAPERVAVIYNGIDPGTAPTRQERAEARVKLGVADDVVVIGTIARLDPVKDLGTLISAAADAGRGRLVHLLVVGDGPERIRLEAQAKSEMGSTSVCFAGHQNNARTWLAGCDVYVNSSITEGVSLTILEAMAAALPVVATSVGGTPEVIDASCGRLVPPRSQAAMTAAIRELAENATLRQTLGATARKRMEAQFALDRMIAEYRHVY